MRRRARPLRLGLEGRMDDGFEIMTFSFFSLGSGLITPPPLLLGAAVAADTWSLTLAIMRGSDPDSNIDHHFPSTSPQPRTKEATLHFSSRLNKRILALRFLQTFSSLCQTITYLLSLHLYISAEFGVLFFHQYP